MFPCGWCGTRIESYEQHFAHPTGQPCRDGARTFQPVVVTGESMDDNLIEIRGSDGKRLGRLIVVADGNDRKTDSG